MERSWVALRPRSRAVAVLPCDPRVCVGPSASCRETIKAPLDHGRHRWSQDGRLAMLSIEPKTRRPGQDVLDDRTLTIRHDR